MNDKDWNPASTPPSNIQMGYRELLKKYMQHVIDIEGDSFVGKFNTGSQNLQLTPLEIEELQSLENEL